MASLFGRGFNPLHLHKNNSLIIGELFFYIYNKDKYYSSYVAKESDKENFFNS